MRRTNKTYARQKGNGNGFDAQTEAGPRRTRLRPLRGPLETRRQRLATHTVATGTGQDLIRLKTQSVDDYVNRMSGIDYKAIHLTVNKEAYEDGMKSGRNINLNQTGITNPTMQISR